MNPFPGIPCKTFGTILVVFLAAVSQLAAGPPHPVPFVQLPEKEYCLDTYLYKQIDLPAGKVLRAWTALSATHEYVLYVNSREASRSRYGRVASTFRMAQEIEDLKSFFRPGKNTLAVKVHRWSAGRPTFHLQSEVQVETSTGIVRVPIVTDKTWLGSHEAPADWNTASFKPAGWLPVQVVEATPQSPRIRPDQQQVIAPAVPVLLAPSVTAMLPQIAEMSDWRQQVIGRNLKTDTERLTRLFQTDFVAQRYAEAIERSNTNMGDSYSITGFPVGNGLVFTTIGPYPFFNTTATLGPEYQYPVQWNPGSTFAGDALTLRANGQPLSLEDQWMWKIRKTDVVVTAAADPGRKTVLYTLTFAPPKLKALLRIYAVANIGEKPLQQVVLENAVARTKVAGKTLTETVKHIPIADALGESNTRTMITGALEDLPVSAVGGDKNTTGTLKIQLGDIAPGACRKCLVYHVTFLETVNGAPVPSDAAKTLAAVKTRSFDLLEETIRHGREYQAATTTLEAPGPWGRRVADFVDDVKTLVQAQQFERTGAVGPMWFFSDQWIRDSCGPVKSFLRTGQFDNARRVLHYFYRASLANRKILNWVPMDVPIDREWPAVDDWSRVTMNFADRHANCEVPSWIILQHSWYLQFTGDTKTIAGHWGYLKRCFYGQFDNPGDKISRPDFKIPFHGDETYIYSGGEALWNDRYDLQQSSYPGGNITSADSSFELAAAGDALAAMARVLGKKQEAGEIAALSAKIRSATEKYYWMEDLGMYAQGMSVACPGQRNRYPMANMQANVLWSGYARPGDRKADSNVLRMAEYLLEESGVLNPIIGYDVTVGMLQGQGLHSLAALDHPWAEKAFYALLMIAGDTTEFSEWMAPGADYRTMFRANRIRPWEAGINLDALLFYLTGFEPDAARHHFTLTPRLPTGVYSPIHWDNMTVRHLPMGRGWFDLEVAGSPSGQPRQRTYTLVSHSPENVTVGLNALVPFADITGIEVNGVAVPAEAATVFGQARVPVPASLPAGQTLRVVVRYSPRPVEPIRMEPKLFQPPCPVFGESDVVVFTGQPARPGRKLLRDELAAKHKTVLLDATLPTDVSTFEAALLTPTGLRTRMLILDEGSMVSYLRKETFWWDPGFARIIGQFLDRGGVVLETASGNRSSRWLEKVLTPGHFSVDSSRGGDVLAADKPDPQLDAQFSWLDEKQALACGKWAGYWAGEYTMKYLGGSSLIKDGALIWGEQEQPHGSMQYTVKTTPGQDHLIRVRTWPFPRKGFTLQVLDKLPDTWKVVDTVWVPQPKDVKENGWCDVYLTLPGSYVKESTTQFRLGAPKGSVGGIGVPGYASTGAARLWIRAGHDRPPAPDRIAVRSAAAGQLSLPDAGIVTHAGGRIAFTNFIAPYRILGDSQRGALILRPVGRGMYVKSELTSLFPVEQMTRFVEALLDPARRQAFLSSAPPSR